MSRGLLALWTVCFAAIICALGASLWRYHGPAAFSDGSMLWVMGWQASSLFERWRRG